jgi:predicted transcriptional regulator
MKLLQTMKLTDTQKQVLCKIVASPTELTALESIKGNNMVEAKNMLLDLGLITFDDNEISITEQGLQLMRDYNLIDQQDQLTDEGSKHAFDDNNGSEDDLSGELPPEPNFESFSLIRQINDLIL